MSNVRTLNFRASSVPLTKVEQILLRNTMENGNKKNIAARVPPALNPEQLALVQPWKDFISRGVVAEISATFTPGGTNVKVTLAETVPVPDGTSRQNLPPGFARQLVLDSNLIPQKGKGKGKGPKTEENLPARSLCASDMEDSDKFEKRIKAVALKLGSSTALGRMGSMQIDLHTSPDFQTWWSKATAAEKAKLVIDEKHLKTLTAEQLVFFHEKLQAVPSPFRGSLPDPTANNAEEKKEAKEQGVQRERQAAAQKQSAERKRR